MLGEYTFANLLVFIVLVVAALLLDLFAHKRDKPISMRDAGLWSIFWILLSIGFACYLGSTHGSDQGMLFLTGYFLEKSLSVDNLFVFIAIFSSFSVRAELQHRVLYYGIIGAVIMRLIFVGLAMVGVPQDLQYLIKGGIILFACALDMRKYLVKK